MAFYLYVNALDEDVCLNSTCYSCNLQNILIPSTALIINSIMPPISFDWGTYRGEIESLRARGTSAKDIWQSLFNRYDDIPSSHRTLERKIKAWQEEDPSFAPRYSIYEDLRLLEFCNNEWLYNANHEEMLEAVNSERVSLQLPFEITSRQLEKLRVQNGLRYARRHEATEEEVDEKREAIIRGMKENGASRYG